MKKIIGIIFILLIGLLILGGCSSPVEPATNQKETVKDQISKPQPTEPKIKTAEVPQPPALPEE